jgi:predicted O-methyltransferase YrrM
LSKPGPPAQIPPLTAGRLGLLGALVDRHPAVARAIPGPEPWSLAPGSARLLAGLILELPIRSVLELGAGRSSLVIAAALAEREGGRLTSVEQDPEWCVEAWAGVRRARSVDARLLRASPRLTLDRRGVYFRLAGPERELAARGPFDLVLIDAPQYFYGRDGGLHLAWGHLHPGAVILLDDAGRSGERRTVRRWLATYPGLELVHRDPALGSNGVAVLRYAGDDTVRVRPGVLLGSTVTAFDGWRRWRSQRRAWEARRSALSGEPAAPPAPASESHARSDR